MLRPERMSKISVTGSKRVMDEVIETVHDLHLLDITDYDGTWEGFTPGDPVEGADRGSDRLVTVRAIESILGVDGDDVDSLPTVSDEEIESELGPLRDEVNELDERRDEIDDEIREIDEQIDAMEPFADLGIDLDLLSGYRSLQVAVGRGDRAAVESAVAADEAIDDYEIFTGDGDVLAVFARPAKGAPEDALGDALVSSEFASLDVPSVDASESPEEYVDGLRERRRDLESQSDEIRRELDAIRDENAEFVLAAEEKLTIRVQRAEAPLSFATTANAFIAEGWIPTTRFDDLVSAVSAAAGDHVEVEEVERASFARHGGQHVRERVHEGEGDAVATDGGADERIEFDGGTATGEDVVMSDDKPPVVQSNPDLLKPFETLVNAVGRPRYDEFDPTVIVFLTFPLFFGFMIGDLGYGLLYTLIGAYIYSNFDSPGIKSMGGVGVLCGLSTMLFGVLYGEVFGLHLVTEYLWTGALGLSGPVIEKGISPAAAEWALAWLTLSIVAGLIHMNIGWIFDFVENYQLHGATDAVLESGSWILLTNSLWIWIFSDHLAGMKPDFIYEVFAGAPYSLGFTGFPEMGLFTVGGHLITLPLIGVVVGLAMLIAGEGILALEALEALAHVLSYARLMAVLLAKAGMALTVNLLFFGAYISEGEYHFMLSHGSEYVLQHHPEANIVFPGLVHGSLAAIVFGLLVLLIGHLVVLLLGITSAGLQAVRLEYVEFFGKFYEGGGRPYRPFGYDRTSGPES